ncbi:uncharacterized protein LOC126309067 isoform X1 [Schistocerca gregaria]|uniref:uncharacterized protein LOC126309067 isoform X1 n=1 Tax=Schistocerca gregaria TaxID=7010 RepID=UPI00211DE6AE|nr:uncharacterized protein LOC126309067 isoform X1 [Schistocerca gregaria]
MDTYSLLSTVPLFADVSQRLRRSYHSLKHVHTSLRLCLQLAEVFVQLVLLCSRPLIVLCHFPILITDRILHDVLAFLIRCCPILMWPASDIHETVRGFVLSITIGRVIVFFLLIISYILYVVIECLRASLNFVLFFISPLRTEEGAAVHAASHRPALEQKPARTRLQPGHGLDFVLGSSHRRAARGPGGPSPRRRGSHSSGGLTPRRGPWSAAVRVASPSSSSKTSEEGGDHGSAAAARRSVVYRLRRRRAPDALPIHSPRAAADPQPLIPLGTKSVSQAKATATSASSETCSVSDSRPASQYDATDAQRIIVSTILDPITQDLEDSLKSGRSENWYDALSSEHAPAEVERQGFTNPGSVNEILTQRDTQGDGLEQSGIESLRVAVPKLEAPQSSDSCTLDHLQVGGAAAGTARGSVSAARPGNIRRRHSFIPRLSPHITNPSQQSSTSSND